MKEEPKLFLHERLVKIQQELKAPKSNRNEFAGFNYRSCEDILESVKPLLGDCSLVIKDELLMIGERYYVKATATMGDGNNFIYSAAYAREEESKKGMDGAQITGAASSYARKYALNGLFAIDDTKDPDTQDNSKKEVVIPTPQNDVYERGMLGQKCKRCGANMIRNPKTGNWFCEKKCWTKYENDKKI